MYKKAILTSLALISSTCAIYAHTIDIYGHRGLRPLAPENTLVGYTDALKVGVDVLDMDINMTKDHVLVVAHDLTLNNQITKDSHGKWITKSTPIKSLTLNELKQYTVGQIKPNTAMAKMYPNHIDMKNVHIPTLIDVINYVKSTVGNRIRLQIEIKTNPYRPKNSYSAQDMAKALYKVLKQTNMINNVEVQSFEWLALVKLHQLDSNIKTAYLTDHTTEPMSEREDHTPKTPNKWTYPLQPSKYNYNYPEMVKKLQGTFWEPYEQDLTHEKLKEAHQLGLKVVTWSWTEDEGQDFNYKTMNQLIEWGVDGIITDRPDILRGLESARGLNLPASYPNTPLPKKY